MGLHIPAGRYVSRDTGTLASDDITMAAGWWPVSRGLTLPLQRPGPSPEEVVPMHARVSSYKGDVDRLVEGFQKTTHLLQQLDGFQHAVLLINREHGRAITLTMWDSEQARAASAERAAHLREEASETAGTTAGAARDYEVALEVGAM